MKFLRKITSFLLLFSLLFSSVIFLCACQSSTKKDDISSLPITPSSNDKTQYSPGFVGSEAKRLYTFLEAMIKEEYGDKLPLSVTLLENCFKNAISALEARGVSEEDTKSIVDDLLANEELFRDFISAEKIESPALPIKAAYTLFTKTVSTLGVKRASLFVYDVFIVYCSYMTERYMTMYVKNPTLSFLYTYAVEWNEKAESIKKIGEDNFSLALRAILSLSSVNSLIKEEESVFSLSLSGRELVIFLKTEGEMISKLTLTDEDIEFILEELGSGTSIPIFNAIVETGDTKRLSTLWNDVNVKLILVDILLNANEDLCNSILNGDASLSLFNATRCFSDDDYENLNSLFSNENEEKYKQYFAKTGKSDDYLIFKEGVKSTTLEDAKNSGSETFAETFKNYICTASPAMAFLVFKNDKG